MGAFYPTSPIVIWPKLIFVFYQEQRERGLSINGDEQEALHISSYF